MKRTLARLLAVITALFLAFGFAGAAHADQKKLQLSYNQAGPFSDNLATPLFTGTYVPGTVTSRFWVKNNSSNTARVTIALVGKPNPNALETHLAFTAGIGGTTTSTPIPIYQDGKKKNECRTLVTGPTVDGGKTQAVDVNMIMDGTAPSNQSASFSFVVTLSQVANKGQVDVCGPQSPGGSNLATTVVSGTPTALASFSPVSSAPQEGDGRTLSTSLGAAAVVLAAGMALGILRRRRLG